MDISALGKAIGGIMGMAGKGDEGSLFGDKLIHLGPKYGNRVDDRKPKWGYITTFNGEKMPLTDEPPREAVEEGEPKPTSTKEESNEESGVAKLGKTLGSLFGEQATPAKGSFVEPNVTATPQSVSFDWQRRNPFAPTSGRKQ